MNAYTENTLVQQTIADNLEQERAFQSASAGYYENIERKWLISYLGFYLSCNTALS